MNKKNLVQIVIIFACFSASGVVIYNNFLKKADLPSELTGQVIKPGVQPDAPILPGGASFDLDVISKAKFRFNLLDYPKLKPESEVGVEEQNVLKPLVQSQSGTNTTKN
jgi:hypothetical protein